MNTLHPPGWASPSGYVNGVSARGRLVFVSGQVGWDPVTQTFDHADLIGQFRRAMQNVTAVLAEADARPAHLVRLTWFITDKAAYLANLGAIGEAYRAVVGRHYPPMTVVVVDSLLEDEALLEIEATAVVPD